MQRLWQSIVGVFTALSPARRRVAIVVAALFALCVLTMLTSHQGYMPKRTYQNGSKPLNENPATAIPETEAISRFDRDAKEAPLISDHLQLRAIVPDASNDPRIAYSADLGVTTKDFVQARSSMEDILDRHRGYAARLRMTGNPAGSSLSATLKVPASEYSSALADLKSIGDVQQDDESADEIIQQHGDLEARLQNVRNNAHRLEQLLKENSDKSIDVDYVQRQLIALRAEIAKLELERHNIDTQVVFSNIHFSLREVRDTPAETLSAQFRKAAVSGFTDLITSLSALAIILVSYGPSFLLWAAILFFPARYLWRRSRTPLARNAA
jgi:hypothetical protein